MLANNRDPIAVRQVQWLTVAPVLHLLRALRNGFRLRVLIPCSLLIVVLMAGPQSRFTLTAAGLLPGPLALSPGGLVLPPIGRNLLPAPLFSLLHWPVSLGGDPQADPWVPLLAMLLVVLVTMLTAVAVARATSQEFCKRSRCGAVASLKYALNSILPSLAATALAFVLLLCLGLPLALAQWLFESDSRWLTISGIVSIPLAIYAILAVFGAFVLFAGWLLSLAAIGTDDCDGADALSRGVSYVLTHKLLTGVYFYIALIVSLLARVLATVLVSIAAGQLPAVMLRAPDPEQPQYALSGVALQMLGVLPVTVQLGSFLSAVCLIYLLLRGRVDAVDLYETGPAITPASPTTAAAPAAPAASPAGIAPAE